MTCKSCDDFLTTSGSSTEKTITNISVSVDNICTITSINHGLNTGDTIYIYDSDSVANIDGYWVVANVLTADTFTIQTSQVTIAGSNGKFQYDIIINRKCREIVGTIPGGYTYCGCYCENCCPSTPIYQDFSQSLFSPCTQSGYDIAVTICNSLLRITGYGDPMEGGSSIAGAQISDYSDCNGFETIPTIEFDVFQNTNIKKEISNISVGNPTIITTTTNHGLQTGDIVNITDSDSNPLIDGVHEVTVIDATNFSIAQEVTTQGTTGTIYCDVVDGLKLRSCEHLKDRYELWYLEQIAQINDSYDDECERNFLISLYPTPEEVLQYLCCNEIKREISFEAGDGKCCLDQGTSDLFEIDNWTFTATGNLNVKIKTTILQNNSPCLFLPKLETPPEGFESTEAGPCNVGFSVTYTNNAYVPEYDDFTISTICCSQIIVLSSEETSESETTANILVPNCDYIHLGQYQSNCGETASDTCLTLSCGDPPVTCNPNLTAMQSILPKSIDLGFYSSIIENGITYVNICAPAPTPSYWSGTLNPTESQEVSILKTDTKRANGSIYFNNKLTKLIDKIYLSKKNYLKEKRDFEFTEWNELGTTKKTHLKIKYGKNKIFCIFKITDEVKEFDDFYEIPVKFVYGKLPPDNTLLNIEFILPPKTTSHLANMKKLEILKRIKKRSN